MDALERSPVDTWIGRVLGLEPDRLPSQGEVEKYQLARLNATVAQARRLAPFYRDRWQNIDPAPFTVLADLERLPFTTAEDLRNAPGAFLCVSQDEVSRVVTLRTSGTTRAPKRLFFSADDLERTIEFFGVGMGTLVRPGNTVLILLPGATPDSVGDLLARALARVGIRGVVHGPGIEPGANLRAAATLGVDGLVGAPGQLLAMARHPDAGRLGRERPLNLLLTTDYVPQAIVTELELVWNARVFEHYGMTEMGLGGGVQCAARQGYHLRAVDILFEVVDPETGQRIEDDRMGEVVFTTLTRRAMPLIRYRTGDWGRWIMEPCPCGSQLRRLGKISGRLRGSVKLPGEVALPLSQLDEALFVVPGLLDFQAEILTQDWRTVLRVTVWARASEPGLVLDAAARALAGIPTLRVARAAGLEVAPPVWGAGNGPVQGVFKRKIVDRRKGTSE